MTRDVWGITPPTPFFFAARTSFITMRFPLKAEIPYDALKWNGEWPKRCCQRDNEGTTLAELQAYRPDVLVLDFIDERYDLVEQDGKYLLATIDYVMSGVEVPALTDRLEVSSLWETSMQWFVDSIRPTPVILHRAPWATFEADDSPANKTQQLYAGKSVSVQSYHQLMESMYDRFLDYMPEALPITVNPLYHKRDRSHMWGPAPFHYVKDYYLDFSEKLSTHLLRIKSRG